MIDKTDYLIIHELQKDGRASNAELAAKIGISPLTVAKRFKRLLSENIITIRAMPNPYKLGLSANALIAINADVSEIESIYHRLSDNYYVNYFAVIFGRYDIMLIVYFPSWNLLHSFIHEELWGIKGVHEIETFDVKEIKKRYNDLFDEKSVYEKSSELKEVDLKIIQSLVKDGRMSNNDLSSDTGIHTSTISRRIAFMKKEKIIKISAVPHTTKVGYLSCAHIILEVSADTIDRICNELFQCKEIHQIMTLTKGNGIIVGIHAFDNETLFELIQKKIANIEGIKSAETFIRAKLYKHYYGTHTLKNDFSKKLPPTLY